MPGRSAAQLKRTPKQWRDHQEEERRRTAAALLAELRRAAERGDAWYRWLLDRRDGTHRHDLSDAQGRPIACPVGGCDHARGSATPHLPDGARRRSGVRERPSP